MNHVKIKKTALTLSIAAGMLLPSTKSHADYFLPKIVMIEHGARAATISIFNQSNYDKVYTFGWERRVQLPDGKRLKLDEGQTVEGYRPADDYLIYSPRQVVVPAGQSQKVRLLARRTADMLEGEYHSHFKISPDRLGEKPPPEVNQGFGGVIELKTEFSLPVFLRHGKTNVDFEYQNIRTFEKEGRDHIGFTVLNNSTRSVHTNNLLECKIGDKTHQVVNALVRIYSESKSFPKELAFKKKEGTPKLSECESATLTVSAIRDFQHKRNAPLKTYKIK